MLIKFAIPSIRSHPTPHRKVSAVEHIKGLPASAWQGKRIISPAPVCVCVRPTCFENNECACPLHPFNRPRPPLPLTPPNHNHFLLCDIRTRSTTFPLKVVSPLAYLPASAAGIQYFSLCNLSPTALPPCPVVVFILRPVLPGPLILGITLCRMFFLSFSITLPAHTYSAREEPTYGSGEKRKHFFR